MLEPAEAKTVIYTSLLGGELIIKSDLDIIRGIYEHIKSISKDEPFKILVGINIGTIAITKCSKELLDCIGLVDCSTDNIIMIDIRSTDETHCDIAVHSIKKDVDFIDGVEYFIGDLFNVSR
jgi:hypothetical protein